jgi:hypothetical protein
MERPDSVSTTEIANALGISRVAVLKKAKKQGWRPTGERIQGGGNKYLIGDLPLKAKVKIRLRNWQLAKVSLSNSYQYQIDELEDQKREITSRIAALKRKQRRQSRGAR